MKFQNENKEGQQKRNRSRNIMWYNPPYDMRVKSDLGRKFLKIVDESFPEGHVLRKLFNRNSVKLSYSCMPSVKSIIDSHNTALMQKESAPVTECEPCNCRAANECPLEGKCREMNTVYQATVTTKNSEETYIGLTATEFKTRHSNHKSSFKNEKLRYATELSKHVWKLKDQNMDFEIKWKIMGKAKPYSNVTKRCNLCILEKYFIICHSEKASLNKKSELVSGCRHKRKYLLKHYK